MTARQAARRIETRLQYLNMAERRTGLPNLEAGDQSWPSIHREIQLRLGRTGMETVRDGRPSMASLEALGAWVLVAMQILDDHETADVASGGEGIAA